MLAVKYPLIVKLSVFVLGIVVMLGVGLSVSFYVVNHRVLTNAEQSKAQASVALLGDDIQRVVRQLRDNLSFLSVSTPIKGLSSAPQASYKQQSVWISQLQHMFRAVLISQPDYAQVRLIGAKDHGRELVRLDQTEAGIHSVHPAALQQKENRNYYRLGVSLSSGTVGFSEVDYNVEHGKVQYPILVTLRAMMPIYSDKQSLFGLLVINVNIQNMLSSILNSFPLSYDTLIYDEHGNGFYWDAQNRRLHYVAKNQSLPANLFGVKGVYSTNDFVNALTLSDQRITVRRNVYENHNSIHALFTIVLSKPKTELTVWQNPITVLLLASLLITLLLAILSFFVVRRMIMPLKNLATSIEEYFLTPDHPCNTLPLHLNDEIGRLAKIFDQQYKKLDWMSHFDLLTGLLNRVGFVKTSTLLQEQRSESSEPMAIVIVSVLHFQQFNQINGFEAGDQLLVQISEQLLKLDGAKACARIGPSTFCFLLLGISNKQHLQTELSNIEIVLNKTYLVGGVLFNILISGGAAIYPEDAEDIYGLLQKADNALYVSKGEGNGHFQIYQQP